MLAACWPRAAADARRGRAADTYLVDNAGSGNVGTCTSAPAGDCSLRDAIDAANANAGPTDRLCLPLAIVLDDPLPAVTEPGRRSTPSASAVTVNGSAVYATSYCAATDYAFDLTDSGAAPSSVRGAPGLRRLRPGDQVERAAADDRVGPRRFDNTVSINGQAVGGCDGLRLMAPTGPPTGAHEGDDDLVTAVGSGRVAFSYTPGVEPAAGDKFTALQVTGSPADRTSRRTAVTTPSDLTSPAPVARGGRQQRRRSPRLQRADQPRFGSGAGAFSLSVAGVPRAISSARRLRAIPSFVESERPVADRRGRQRRRSPAPARDRRQSATKCSASPCSTSAAGPGRDHVPADHQHAAVAESRSARKATSPLPAREVDGSDRTEQARHA